MRLVDKVKDQDRENRADGTEADQTEAVRLGVLIASDGGYADAESHDKGNCHRAGGHTAGIKGNGENTLVGEKRSDEYDRIENQQHPAQRDGEENSHHAQQQKETDADGYRKDQNHGIDFRHISGQNLQVWFGDRDGNAESEADGQDQPQLAGFRQLGSHVVADAAHGHLRAERKESHSQDQHGGGQHKGQDESCIHGNQEEADRKHDQTDRKNGSTGFSQLFQ